MATSSADQIFQRRRVSSKPETLIVRQITGKKTQQKNHDNSRSISRFYKAMILCVIALVSSMMMDMEKTFSSTNFHVWYRQNSEIKQDEWMSKKHSSLNADRDAVNKKTQLEELLLPNNSKMLEWDSYNDPKTAAAAQLLKKEFIVNYGRYGRSLLARALTTFPQSTSNSTSNTTLMINQIQTLAEALHGLDKPLSFVVAGNGAAAGYGNYRSQAYSNKFLILLKRLFPSSTMTNLALDQTTEFPSSFCLGQYMPTMNVVIWDFVGSTPQRLESFLRISLLQGAKIFLGRVSSVVSDTGSMKKVLRHYCPSESMFDQSADGPLKFQSCIWLENVESMASDFRSLSELHDDMPPGFDELETSFGTGRKPAEHHELDHLPNQRPMLLTTKQHDLIAWLFFWPFLSAFQHKEKSSSQQSTNHETPPNTELPSTVELQDTETSSLILGQSFVASCFSTYDFAARDAHLEDIPSGDVNLPANLPSLIASHTIGSKEEILKPKFGSEEKGWIFDMDEASKRDKKTMQHDVMQHQHESNEEPSFYGMVDWKQAYFGVYQSGILKMTIPLGTNGKPQKKPFALRRGQKPPAKIQTLVSLILCQSDAPMNDKVEECSWRKDVEIRINGDIMKSKPLDPSYGVVVSTRGAQHQGHVQPLCRRVSLGNSTAGSRSLELEVEVTNPRIIWHRKHSTPCSLSHVLLEAMQT